MYNSVNRWLQFVSSYKYNMAYVGKGRFSYENAAKNGYHAIVLTDTFNEKFNPLSKEDLMVLFPLVNQPILSYTLRYLKSNGVETVYLICSKNADSIQDYLNKSGWLDSSNEMQISIIVSHECMSLGDTLREIDSKRLIRNDFILVKAGVISNIYLKPIIEEHRENYKNNKQLLMTEIFTQSPKQKSRSQNQRTVLVLDEKSKRIIHHHNTGNERKFALPLSIFKENSRLSIRYDLTGSHITICSPHVLTLYSDNFDFQTKDDFTKGILENEEVLGNTINAYIAHNEYACSVANFQTYDAVSKDVIDRWVYPFAPDVTLMPLISGFKYLRQNIYLAKDLYLPRSCNLKRKLIIGEGTKIGDELCITESTIGNNCVIGNNVQIEDTHIWNNVKIGDGCILKSAIIANNVHLLENVKITPGCILSHNVIVGPSVTIEEGTVLADKIPTDEFGEEIILPKIDLGEKGHAFVYQKSSDMKSYLQYQYGCLNTDEEASSTANDADAEESDDDFDDNILVEDSNLFYKEVVESLLRAVEEKIPCENLVLEINGSKYAYNVSMKEVNNLLTLAILDIPNNNSSNNLDIQQYFTTLKPILHQMIALLKNYMKSVDSQMDCLFAMEEFFGRHGNYMPVATKILSHFYDNDVLSEDAIFKWYKDTSYKDEDPTVHQLVRKSVGQFIHWLQTAEEESDEEEESD